MISLFFLTGVTLPFISQGGTSLLISCALVGFILKASGSMSHYIGEQKADKDEDRYQSEKISTKHKHKK